MIAMKDYINRNRFFLMTIFLFQGMFIGAQQNMLPPVRAHHSLVYDEQAKVILLTGGSTPLDGGNSFRMFNDLWKFDGTKWSLIGTAGDARSGIGLAYDSKRKKLFSFGGYTGDIGSRSEFRVFENGDWKNLLSIPGLKAAEPGFVYDSFRDRLVVFGGSSGPGKANGETWEWEGSAWKKFEGASPDPRQAFAMIYDEKRKRTVLFGGTGNNGPQSIFGDTWEFDGKQWTKVLNEGPSARASAGYAYDSDKGTLIIFGGMSKDGFVNDTWSYDGAAWKKLSDGGPPKRAMGYLAYDKERKKLIMFGGRLGWPNDINDTWEWDGTRWTEIKF
jgi:hypothetical protein